MAMPDRAGRFRGAVVDVGVNNTGPNKLCTVVFDLRLDDEYVQGEWADVRAEQLEITSYCYIEKKDGNLNKVQIGMLKDTFAWDGVDPFWFESVNVGDLAGMQVTLKSEVYENEDRIKVAYINPYDSQPRTGVTHADAATRRAIQARIGTKLRASAGASGSTPKPPAKAKAPTAPPSPPTQAAAPTAPSQVPVSTEAGAWDSCVEKGKEDGLAEDAVNGLWWNSIKAVTGGTDTGSLTPEQWGAIHGEIQPIPF